MSKRTPEQEWYQEYIKSDWFKFAREELYKKEKYICSIPGCEIRFRLHPHHLSYEHVGTYKEINDLVWVCSTHHYFCHFKWFRRIPRRRPDLTKRYIQISQSKWRRIKPTSILRFFRFVR